MLRREPQASRLFRAAGRLRQRLGRLVARLADDEHSRLGGQNLLPIRLQRMASPSVRSLEPRFVLNATAELNALGQLVVMGTDSAETVELQVEADGRLRLRDAVGDVIPIVGHPDSAIGQSNSLDPLSITSKRIIFDMRGGDDVLNLDLPNGLDVTVESSAGNDTATVGGGDTLSITPGSLTIDSETIRIDPATRSIAFANSVDLTGDVSVGRVGESTELSFAENGLVIDGTFTVTGDVRLAGVVGPVDLSDAIVTASSPGADLSIDATTGDVLLDIVDDSGGSALNDLRIQSAGSVQLDGPSVELDGDLVIRGVTGATIIDSTVDAGSISIQTQGDISANARLATDTGGIELSTTNNLIVNENLNTTFATVDGDVRLSAADVRLHTMRVLASGGDVLIDGNATIDGLVIIDTGNRQSAATAGAVNIVGKVQSFDGITDVLRIDARGSQANGDLNVAGTIGAPTEPASLLDLNGLIVDAGQIAINSVGVSNGDIRLTGDAITSLGNTIRTSTTGDILIDAPVLLGPGNTTVMTVESVRFTGPVNGQTNTGNLVVNGGLNVAFDDAISGIQELNVETGNVARFTGPTTLGGAMNVEADSIRILGDVTTSDDAVNLHSATQTLVTSGAVVSVGDAVITINATNDLPPGVIDVGSGTLSSTASGDAVRLLNASSVLLGNTRVPNGNLLVSEIAGSVTQSSGANIIVDRLTAIRTGPIDLSNTNNDIRSIERIAANGRVIVNDSVGGLVINRVNSSGNDVSISTAGEMELGDVAVTANGSVVQLQAGSINDVASASIDPSDTDLSARRIELTATSGIGNLNQVDLGGVSELRATTDGGGIDIAHIATGPLTVESLKTQSGSIQLLQTGAGHPVDLVSVESVRGNVTVVAEGTISAQQIDLGDGDLSLDAQGEASDLEIFMIVASGQILGRGQDITIHATDNLVGEVTAKGMNGRVELDARGTLELRDNVEIHASKITSVLPSTQPLPLTDDLNIPARAVSLAAENVRFGENIEIFTGASQGTARIFGPRPSVIPDDVSTERPIKRGETRNGSQRLDENENVIPAAFYDPDSISVNILEQAAVNDANGILTVDIGQTGERGLSVEIDWGAGSPERRFQQLNNLSADEAIFFDVDASGNPFLPPLQPQGAATLSVTHFYRQDDIIDSKFNGRTSATAPLNVLFAVRHHESILVQAKSITQRGVTDDLPVNDVAPGATRSLALVSSTDSLLTARDAAPGLESGSVSFIIPSLSIPVAFFPVREVIPEIETPQFVVRAESKAAISQTTVENVETVTASTSNREEYFRLRVLSPDPDGEDLAKPEKLPEDILVGEKLNALFKRLPDGTYEIEYVLGDGDERTILRVEVRNGAAKLSVGDLEEGVLKLKRLTDNQ